MSDRFTETLITEVRHIVRALFAGCLCALVCSCGSSSSSSAKQVITEPVHLRPADGTDQLLILINKARRKKHRPPLTLDYRLGLAAKDHSNSMAEHNYFAHRGRDGSNFRIRMKRHGYPPSHSAENIAKALDANTVFQMWYDSKGHKVNMMNKKYTHVGIMRTSDYWTANFSAPAGT